MKWGWDILDDLWLLAEVVCSPPEPITSVIPTFIHQSPLQFVVLLITSI